MFRQLKIYTQNLFSYVIPEWTQKLHCFKNKKNLKFMEIGSYEGQSAVWLLQNILTDSSCVLHCIDTFQGISEDLKIKDPNVICTDYSYIEDHFKYNTQEFGSKVVLHKGNSFDILRTMNENNFENNFDMIYIDGDHTSKGVITDAILSFPLLKSGGIMIFDDYLWNVNEVHETRCPKLAIDSFLRIYSNEIEIIDITPQQVYLKKI